MGKNGSGKTSLIKVIRHLTFCDGQFGTDIKGPQYWTLHYHNVYERGHWHLTEMKSSFEHSAINLRKRDDVLPGDELHGMASFLQSMTSSRHSKGETSLVSLNMMFAYILGGEEGIRTGGEIEAKNKDYLDFQKMALKPIEAAIAENASWKSMWETMLQYYKDNKIADGADNKKYKGITVLMDEPDAGMDISNVEYLYKMIMGLPPHYQKIVVVHNAALIHRLAKVEGINFIELTDGYVEEIEKFIGGIEL